MNRATFVKLDEETRQRIRLRAAQADTTMSAILRELIKAALGAPTPAEALFLGVSGHKWTNTVQE